MYLLAKLAIALVFVVSHASAAPFQRLKLNSFVNLSLHQQDFSSFVIGGELLKFSSTDSCESLEHEWLVATNLLWLKENTSDDDLNWVFNPECEEITADTRQMKVQGWVAAFTEAGDKLLKQFYLGKLFDFHGAKFEFEQPFQTFAVVEVVHFTSTIKSYQGMHSVLSAQYLKALEEWATLESASPSTRFTKVTELIKMISPNSTQEQIEQQLAKNSEDIHISLTPAFLLFGQIHLSPVAYTLDLECDGMCYPQAGAK